MTFRHILKTITWAGDMAQVVKDLFHKHEDLGLDSQALTQDYRQKCACLSPRPQIQMPRTHWPASFRQIDKN